MLLMMHKPPPEGIYAKGPRIAQYVFGINDRAQYDERKAIWERPLQDVGALVYRRLLSTAILELCSLILNILWLGFIFHQWRKAKSSSTIMRKRR
jgi:hypothetical protein